MKIKDRENLLKAMQKLANELDKNHRDAEITQYVNQTLKQLKKSNGVAFTGVLQEFFNNGAVIKASSSASFNKIEEAIWTEVFSFQQLGNNLFIL